MMIEKVAASFYCHMIFNEYNLILFRNQPKEIQDHYKQAAKLAIKAMREPTEEMVEAAYGSPQIEEDRESFKCNYQVMIEAALKE